MFKTCHQAGHPVLIRSQGGDRPVQARRPASTPA